ncbi:hypothetical protein MNBD_GAMMA25-1420 [hydrothermal vent metagenome]|uniref:DUF2835 domain-containing protein n=1 Tax=hydrothermal vent metagenome TaxID=652676 RepID=A0A3B1BIW1_9ZZZZ
MTSLRFHLNITVETYRHYYQGQVNEVQVRSLEGQNLRFPAAILRPYLSHTGVSGLFELEFDENRRFVSLQRLEF